MSISEEPQVDAALKAQLRALLQQMQSGSLSFKETLDAIKEHEQAAESAHDLLAQAQVAYIRGVVYGLRSNYNSAIQAFEFARRTFDRAGAASRLPACDVNLGETYRLKGNFGRARQYFTRARTVAETMEMEHLQAIALLNQGQIWISTGKLPEALANLRQVLDMAGTPFVDQPDETDLQRQDRLDMLCETHYAMVKCCLAQEDVGEAWEHACRALKLAEELNLPMRRGYANRALGNVITKMRNMPGDGFSHSPDDYYRTALAIFQDMEAEGEVARTLFAQGMSLGRRNKRRKAARLFEQAMAIFTRLGMTDDAARAAEAQLEVI